MNILTKQPTKEGGASEDREFPVTPQVKYCQINHLINIFNLNFYFNIYCNIFY